MEQMGLADPIRYTWCLIATFPRAPLAPSRGMSWAEY